MTTHHLKTEVVIMGGGLAGLNAAIAAAERGVQVVVMDKGKIERSGNISGGVDHFMAYLETGEPWDSREAYLNYVAEEGYGIVNVEIHNRVFCDELRDALSRMEQIGSPLFDPKTGQYYRTTSMGQPGPYMINFNGKHLKPNLAREVRRLGCTVLDRVMVTRLFVSGGRLSGVLGLHTRTGELWFIECKALIASTGNTNRLYETPTRMPFNTWLCPYDTGEAQRLAFEAGATLANMEFLRMTIVPKGFSAPGLNAFTGMGSHFINGLGERYMTKYHEKAEKAPRNWLVWGTLSEIKAGRGPVFVDSRHLPPDKLTHLRKTLGLDKETLDDFFEAKKIDIAKDPLEVMVSEAMQTGPIEVVGSGIHINMNCMSTVEGLFAAGDCADQMKIVHMAVAGGYCAGKCAGDYASRNSWVQIPSHLVRDEEARTMAPLNRKKGLPYQEVGDVLRRIMLENVGANRTQTSLETAQRKIKALSPYIDEVRAKDAHELMRTIETASLLKVGEIMTHASLFRKESRFIPYYYRADFPETDNGNWCGQVLVKQTDGKVMTEFKPLKYGKVVS
jgi:adenylylsulfate reductase, subunit A